MDNKKEITSTPCSELNRFRKEVLKPRGPGHVSDTMTAIFDGGLKVAGLRGKIH